MRPAIVLAASLPLLLFSLAARAGDEVRERAAKKACLAILTSAIAGFLRAEFSYLNMGNFRSYLSGGMGAGTSFLAVVSKDCDMNSCPLSHSDTLHGGALGLLGGLGAIYHLTPNIGLFVDVKEIVTFRTVLALTEINLGVAVAFNPW